MPRENRRRLLILALVALCFGVFGAGPHYWFRGVPGKIEFLFQAMAGLAEKSQEHDEKIGLIVAHIGELKASLCEFHGEEPRPSFCGRSDLGLCAGDLQQHDRG